MNYETQIIGTEHADELSIVQPSYNNLDCLSGNEARAVKESIELYDITNEEGE